MAMFRYLVSLTLISIGTILQSTGQSLSDFNLDGNSTYSVSEVEVYLMHTKIKEVAKLDPKKKGSLDRSRVAALIIDLQRKTGKPDNFTEDDVTSAFPIGLSLPLAGILIRETVEDISPYSQAKAIDKAKPALISYTHDFKTKANYWSFVGTVMRPIPVNNFYIAPGITINKTTAKDSTKEANSFVPKVGFFLMPEDKKGSIHIVRAYINYATDFYFKSKQVGVEFEWEPIFSKGPFGVYQQLIPSIKRIDRRPIIEWRLQIFPHIETGYIFDAEGKENLEEGKLYLRAGAQVGWAFRFFERVELTGTNRYLSGIAGVPKDSWYNTTTLIFNLGENENISISAKYQQGKVPLTQENIENLVIGLGLKL